MDKIRYWVEVVYEKGVGRHKEFSEVFPMDEPLHLEICEESILINEEKTSHIPPNRSWKEIKINRMEEEE